MCSKNPIYPWKFSTETSSEELENFLTTCYSGAPRACNILTKTETGERVTDPIFDSVIQDVFQEYHIPMDENVAYVLPLHYPATIIARKAPSSIIEITKGSLSADESGKSTDSSQIQFHPDKIMYFGRMFSEILQRVSV